ncbi:type II secretion system protein GspG [Candidatus Dependentiae bacterium]|nr:type II secretion system protein GspG [Candidatus Dependentiae bacterium]
MKVQTNHLKPGYSLIELGIALGLISMLMLGGFAIIRQITSSNNKSTTENRLRALDTELERYKISVGDYPKDLEELFQAPQGANARKWSGTNLEEKDLEDAWGQRFDYAPNGKGAQPPYDLTSKGAPGSTAPIYSARSQEA